MKAAFRLTLALIATFGASGCRTAGLSPSARPTPAVVPEPKLSFHLDEFIDEHNRNAERIESLKAKASITGTMAGSELEKPTVVGISGRLSMLRPKNFKLELFGRMQTVADIGSNEDRFWFWVQGDGKNEKEQHVFYCDYADLPTANLTGTYQPDWIIDALGLKPITADEAAAVRVSPGPKPETTMLKFPPLGGGSAYGRVMIVSDVSRRPVEYRVLDHDGKTVIGLAEIKRYSDVTLKDEGGSASGKPETCYIADSVMLKWKRESLSLDILLKDLIVNEPFSDKMKATFVEPKPRGYTPLDLAEATRNLPQEGGGGEMTAVRETLPAPEPRNRVRLNPPVEIHGAEPESRRIATPGRPKTRTPARRVEPDTPQEAPAAALAPVLLPVLDDVVGAVRPQAPGTPYQTAGSADLLGGATFER